MLAWGAKEVSASILLSSIHLHSQGPVDRSLPSPSITDRSLAVCALCPRTLTVILAPSDIEIQSKCRLKFLNSNQFAGHRTEYTVTATLHVSAGKHFKSSNCLTRQTRPLDCTTLGASRDHQVQAQQKVRFLLIALTYLIASPQCK